VQHGKAVVEQAITGPEPGIYQTFPCGGSDDAVGGQAAGLLEAGDGVGRGRAELTRWVGQAEEPEGVKALLDVPDGFSGVALSIERHGAP
jgi:hypothetical protein